MEAALKQPNYAQYEQEKANLQKLNLTPDQYQKAIRKIAKRCGV